MPITVNSASESSTVGSNTRTTENNNSPSTGRHALLVARSAQEQDDYNLQGSSIIRCHTFSPNIKIHRINGENNNTLSEQGQIIMDTSEKQRQNRHL
jgi:hypothetical protein